MIYHGLNPHDDIWSPADAVPGVNTAASEANAPSVLKRVSRVLVPAAAFTAGVWIASKLNSKNASGTNFDDKRSQRLRLDADRANMRL